LARTPPPAGCSARGARIRSGNTTLTYPPTPKQPHSHSHTATHAPPAAPAVDQPGLAGQPCSAPHYCTQESRGEAVVDGGERGRGVRSGLGWAGQLPAAGQRQSSTEARGRDWQVAGSRRHAAADGLPSRLPAPAALSRRTRREARLDDTHTLSLLWGCFDSGGPHVGSMIPLKSTSEKTLLSRLLSGGTRQRPLGQGRARRYSGTARTWPCNGSACMFQAVGGDRRAGRGGRT